MTYCSYGASDPPSSTTIEHPEPNAHETVQERTRTTPVLISASSVAPAVHCCQPPTMIRLRAKTSDAVLDASQVRRVRFLLLEFLPAVRCQVSQGPGIAIVVSDRNREDLTEALQRRIEEIIGCQLVEDD